MKILLSIISLFLTISAQSQMITTFAGNGASGMPVNGASATAAPLISPSGVACDSHGNVYIADHINNAILKVDPSGIINLFAGNGVPGYSGDGGLAVNAQIDLSYNSNGIAVDANNNVFFSDGSMVRRVDAATNVITTFAGTGTYGYSGDGGMATAAEFKTPKGICFDKLGNLFIVDDDNNNVRKVDINGIITTIAGTSLGFGGDGGPATNAKFNMPLAIAVDDSSNIFIADFYNGRIRKIDNSGVITTVAGGHSPGISGCFGCQALDLELPAPMGVTIDRFGNVYASAALDHIIYKITKDGKAFRIAGNGYPEFSGDNGPATAAGLNDPNFICFDNLGNLLIADRRNQRVRKVWFSSSSVPPVSKKVFELRVSPNPSTRGQFNLEMVTNTNEEGELVIKDVVGRIVYTSAVLTNKFTEIRLQVPPGMYFVTANTSIGKVTSKLIIE